jgi:hypothetical protein
MFLGRLAPRKSGLQRNFANTTHFFLDIWPVFDHKKTTRRLFSRFRPLRRGLFANRPLLPYNAGILTRLKPRAMRRLRFNV